MTQLKLKTSNEYFLPASCDYWRFGAGGRQENINAICILNLNIINDKVRGFRITPESDCTG